MILDPKKLIYDTLRAIDGLFVYQNRPEILPEEEMPIVLFSVVQNDPLYTLDKDIASQRIGVNVEVYAKDSIITRNAVQLIELQMRSIDYLMSGSPMDIPDPENYSHVSVKFVY